MSVDLFKNLLRIALQAKASTLHVQADKVPAVDTGSGPVDTQMPTVSGQQILDMLDGVAPNEKSNLLSQGALGKIRGSLNLGSAGKVNYIVTSANTMATSLLVFFGPEEDKKADAVWQSLPSSATSSAAPAAAAVAQSQKNQKAPQEPPLPAEAFTATAAAKAKFSNGLPPDAQTSTSQGHSAHGAQGHAVQPGNTAPAPHVVHIVQAAQPAQSSDPQEIEYSAVKKGEQSVSEGENEIDRFLKDMVKRKASDMHLTGGEPVCFRADGEITRVPDTLLTPEYMKQVLDPIIPPRNREEFLKINDTDFAYELRNVGRFRVNIFRDKNGVGAVLRHIPSTILTAEQLKLSAAITNFCKLNKGLVVVTGPTGSGKSTTLAAMVDLINKTRHDHILTVEDPIEFVHPQQKCLVNQREVHKHTTSFARSLKAALREDPDIILIGEMRDLETISIAIETAETGHLVFGTLHTTTAVSTVDRIIQQFPAERQEQIRMMLAGGLKGVVAQTLLKKIGGGRVAAHEILVVNDAVSAMIREGKNHMIPNHMQTQKADGNILLNDSLMSLVNANIVTPADAYAKAVDKNTLAEMMKRKGIDTAPFEMKKSA